MTTTTTETMPLAHDSYEALIAECKELGIRGFSRKRFESQGSDFSIDEHVNYWLAQKAKTDISA